MRNINLRYVDEAYDENGLLTKFDITMPDNFNFAYDVVDDIAINDPERTAMVWCNPEGEEHTFTFADMKTWSDKTANFMADCGIGRGDFVMVILRRHYQFWVHDAGPGEAGSGGGAGHLHAEGARPHLSPERG